jgi:heat shock protein HtpX
MRKLTTFALMFAVALGISITLGFILSLLGVTPYLQERGINYGGLLIFCLVMGFAGSTVSLFMSKWMAKRAYGIELVDPTRASGEMRWLYDTVRRLADQAGLPKTPEVGFYSSPELNAFATGPTKGDALVAVSTGLLSSMSRDEVEGVLGHEVAHIASGDMVRMSLMQGVVNTLILFAARIVASIIVANMDERQRHSSRFMITMLLEMVFGVLGMMVVNWYSRVREFRADSGGASLAGRHKMIAALEALRDRSRVVDNRSPQLAAFKIFGGGGGFSRLFMTHPPIEARLDSLRRGF